MIITILILLIIILIFYLVTQRKKENFKTLDDIINDIITDCKTKSKISELSTLQKIIDNDINEIVGTIKNDSIKEIVQYSIKDGKRIRPLIGYSIIQHLYPEINMTIRKIISNIELLHNSSLIIDDIMDNDMYRRGKLSVAFKYNKNIAQLAAAELLRLFMKSCNMATLAILENDYYNANKNIIIKTISDLLCNNLEDLIAGQYLDVTTRNDDTIDIIDKKTGTIFRMIFMTAWIICKPNELDKLPEIENIAKNFGLMFQIYDDFTDYCTDLKTDKYNFVNKVGLDKAYDLFIEYYNNFINQSKQLDIYTKEIKIISEYLCCTTNKIYKKLILNS